jgi:hypothetical protein
MVQHVHIGSTDIPVCVVLGLRQSRFGAYFMYAVTLMLGRWIHTAGQASSGTRQSGDDFIHGPRRGLGNRCT